MSETADTFESPDGRSRVRLVYDQTGDTSSPRDADNLGVMWTSHPRYTLGDESFAKYIPEFDQLGSFVDEMQEFHQGSALVEAIVKRLVRQHGATVVMPLYLLDHSGLTISAGQNLVNGGRVSKRDAYACDPGGWDTSFVGFVFDTARTRSDMANLSSVEEYLNMEVREYASYLEGDVYGIVAERLADVERIVKTDGETTSHTREDEWIEEDSCWGFIGHEYAVSEAKQTLADMLKGEAA